MLGRWRLRCPLTLPRAFRRYQITTEVTSQVSVAQIITSNVDRRGISRHTATANAMRPTLPIAAPAASRPAASLPRIVPSSPCCCFFCFSCFSTKVALAGKIAGNARNKPPTPGPHFLAINPAATVMDPPNASLRAYSYHLVFPRAERSRLIFIGLSQDCVPKPEGGSHPCEDRRSCNGKGRQPVPDEQATHTQSVNKEGNRADDHGTSFSLCIGLPIFQSSKGKSGKSDRGRGSKKSDDALGLEQ